MSEIVKMLRSGTVCEDPCRVMDARSGCVCAEAADTITRLQAEVDRLVRSRNR